MTCLLLSATGVAACSGSSSAPGQGGGDAGSGSVPGSIEAALKSTPQTSWDSSYVEFGADADLVALNGGGERYNGPWPLLGWGDENLAAYAQPEGLLDFGFDPNKESAAVTLGLPPNTVTAACTAPSIRRRWARSSRRWASSSSLADGGQIWTTAADSTLGTNDSLNAIGRTCST
ncbi:hypothetical protein GXW82_13680 [Streptacidiphilus sp. 4-A2]|nr:hypothetical protein [Streptacidiphilus sp. 4-A2]